MANAETMLADGCRERHEPPLPVEVRLRAVAAGDPEARGWLYDRYAPVLYRRIRRRYDARFGFDAEEILQDAFVWFLQNDARVLLRFLERTPEEERTEARLEGYLWGLACGVASNRRRSFKRSPIVARVESDENENGHDPEDDYLSRDILFRLAQCLKRNGSRVFLYYTLRYVDGLTPEEVATATGWSRRSTYKLRASLNAAVRRCARVLGLA